MHVLARDRLDRTVAAVVFDWDGTTLLSRRAPARALRSRLERLSALGVHAAAISGTHVTDVDARLRARPTGPGELLLGLNGGSELFGVTSSGPRLLERRVETPEASDLLDRVATGVAQRLRHEGLRVDVVARGPNRRRIDLIPEPAWADPPTARIGARVAAVEARVRRAGFGSIADVVALVTDVARGCGMADPRVTSDATHVEVGRPDKADAMGGGWRRWHARGGAGALGLVGGAGFGDLGGTRAGDSLLPVPDGAVVVSVGAESDGRPEGVIGLGGGPATLLRLLEEQLERARSGRVAGVCHDPRWIVVEKGVDIARHRVTESLFTLASGGVGLRGSVEETPGFGQPLVVADGVYAGPRADDGLLAGPDVLDVDLAPAVIEDVRTLDLRTGVLFREEAGSAYPPARSLRFGSVLEPGVFAVRIEAGRGRLRPVDDSPPGGGWSVVTRGSSGIGVATRQTVRRDASATSVERVIATDASPTRRPSRARAEDRLARAAGQGFERLLSGQRAAWARRWRDVGVWIVDDPESELALRFALFQLWGLVAGRTEHAVGARGLTGSGYAGHVFWDADVFVLPALVTIEPRAAGGMVVYRLRRLAAARALARSSGRAGARFPWESAAVGDDVTPDIGYVGGDRVPILTGRMEEHITADVAWGVVRNAAWTRPTFGLTSAEQGLLAETARYWESRINVDAGGSGHIETVIGPDEYHEHVDDNAFTNVMARWNLRAAARWVTSVDVDDEERERWLETSDALVDGYRPDSGLYEQFRGYFDLEPILVSDIAEAPVAADVLLGRARIAGSQVIKQPDVLMLHHLVPDETRPSSLAPNLAYYGPRTAHGSSLSPAILALLEARAGHPDQALDLLRHSLRIDLDDLGGATAAGLHVGALAGSWQAVLFGFVGADVRHGTLYLSPRLPQAWPRLEVRFRCLGNHVRVVVDEVRVLVEARAPLVVSIDAPDRRIETGRLVQLVPPHPEPDLQGDR